MSDAKTSTHPESTSASHGRVGIGLLHQSELHHRWLNQVRSQASFQRFCSIAHSGHKKIAESSIIQGTAPDFRWGSSGCCTVVLKGKGVFDDSNPRHGSSNLQIKATVDIHLLGLTCVHRTIVQARASDVACSLPSIFSPHLARFGWSGSRGCLSGRVGKGTVFKPPQGGVVCRSGTSDHPVENNHDSGVFLLKVLA